MWHILKSSSSCSIGTDSSSHSLNNTALFFANERPLDQAIYVVPNVTFIWLSGGEGFTILYWVCQI
jgi:hypothetical protein